MTKSINEQKKKEAKSFGRKECSMLVRAEDYNGNYLARSYTALKDDFDDTIKEFIHPAVFTIQ